MSTNSSDVFCKDFIKTVVGYLTNATKDGKALTRPSLAAFIRKNYGRLDKEDLAMWLSASVNMGLFNTSDARFETKRGVKGGIIMVGAKKAASKGAKKAARKPRTPKVAAAPVAAPVQDAQPQVQAEPQAPAAQA